MFTVTRPHLQQRANYVLSLWCYCRRTCRRPFNEFSCRHHDNDTAVTDDDGPLSICCGRFHAVSLQQQPFSYVTVLLTVTSTINKNAPLWIQQNNNNNRDNNVRWFSTTLVTNNRPDNLLDGNYSNNNKDHHHHHQPLMQQPQQLFDTVEDNDRSSVIITSQQQQEAAQVEFRDPWVSIWQKQDCRIYLLGTQHGSARSIQLAKALVQETSPHFVFLELCPNTWSTLLIRYIQHQLYLLSFRQLGPYAAASFGDHHDDNNSAIVTLWYAKETKSLWQRIFMDDDQTNIHWLSSNTKFVTRIYRLHSAGTADSAAANNKQENEFFCAAWQGQRYQQQQQQDDIIITKNNYDNNGMMEKDRQPAVIVLGDRSCWVTHGRYIWYNLMDVFSNFRHWYTMIGELSKLEKKFSHLVPHDDDDVDHHLTQENIRWIREFMQQVFPLWYRIYLKERDPYMAASLEAVYQRNVQQQRQSLLLNQPQPQQQQQSSPTTIVAVVGKSHVDGVEECLQKYFGWEQIVVSATADSDGPTNQPTK